MWKRCVSLQVQLISAFQTFILSHLLLLVETQILSNKRFEETLVNLCQVLQQRKNLPM